MATCKLHGDVGCECKIMNDAAKVVRYDQTYAEFGVRIGPHPIGKFVTHADYHALDQKFQDVRVERDMWRDEFKKAEAELASLRAKLSALDPTHQDPGHE